MLAVYQLRHESLQAMTVFLLRIKPTQMLKSQRMSIIGNVELLNP